jgi:hypothetical protein
MTTESIPVRVVGKISLSHVQNSELRLLSCLLGIEELPRGIKTATAWSQFRLVGTLICGALLLRFIRLYRIFLSSLLIWVVWMVVLVVLRCCMNYWSVSVLWNPSVCDTVCTLPSYWGTLYLPRCSEWPKFHQDFQPNFVLVCIPRAFSLCTFRLFLLCSGLQ